MNIKTMITAAAVAIPMLAGQDLALDMGAPDKTIKMTINEWSGQHLSARVAGAILEKAGYDVEYVTAGYGPQFIAMAEGDLHAAMEVWTSNLPGQFNEMADKGAPERPFRSEESDYLAAGATGAYGASVAYAVPSLLPFTLTPTLRDCLVLTFMSIEKVASPSPVALPAVFKEPLLAPFMLPLLLSKNAEA